MNMLLHYLLASGVGDEKSETDFFFLFGNYYFSFRKLRIFCFVYFFPVIDYIFFTLYIIFIFLPWLIALEFFPIVLKETS